jgi:hypothetical protein
MSEEQFERLMNGLTKINQNLINVKKNIQFFTWLLISILVLGGLVGLLNLK